MKLSMEKKVIAGFIVNILVVAGLSLLFYYRISPSLDQSSIILVNGFFLGLIILSILLLIVVFFIIENQLNTQKEVEKKLNDHRQLLQSILDNTSNPVFIKKLNGEYLFVNKECQKLFNLPEGEVIGKTDQDFLPTEIAKVYRDSDYEVLKAEKELKIEQIVQMTDGPHTFIAVKFPLYDSTGRVYAIGSISTDITDRKNMESSMVEGDQFFTMSLDILVVAKDGMFLKFNPALERVLGYSKEELFHEKFSKYIYPEDIELTMQAIRRLETGENLINFENRWICKDGSIKWLTWTAASDPKSRKLYAVAHDSTVRKANQESLKVYEKFFNMSFDALVVAKGEYFIKINQAFTRILGRDQDDMDRAPFLTFTHPDDTEKAKLAVEELRKGNTMINFKARSICKDGSYKWLHWNATADLQSGLLYGVARDITEQVEMEDEQKRMLEQLYENDQKLRLIMENIGDGVVVANQDKKIIMANFMANEILGVENDDSISSNLSDQYELYFPDEKTIFPSQNLPIERAFIGESTDDVDVVLWDARNQIKKRVLLSGRPIVDQKNHVIAAVLTIKDISRYKQMEEELKEAELKFRNIIGFRKGGDSLKT